jgi:hypothetical protein
LGTRENGFGEHVTALGPDEDAFTFVTLNELLLGLVDMIEDVMNTEAEF